MRNSGIIYKKELAQKYNVSARQLGVLLNKSSDVLIELQKLGYNKRQKHLTPKQLKAIYNLIGSPEENGV